MILEAQNARRLGIYVVNTAGRAADEYVFHFLEHIREILNSLCIVCVGGIAAASRERLLQYADTLQEARDGAFYCDLLERLSRENPGQYDELLLMDDTLFGPLYPIKETFQTIACRDLDFWGIAFSGKEPEVPFLAIRSSLFRKAEFTSYCDAMRHTHADGVRWNPAEFIRYFTAHGFAWATYTGTEYMDSFCPDPAAQIPLLLVRDRRCPLVDRRCFSQDYTGLLEHTGGSSGRELLDYIEKHLDYDADLIWENLLHTCNHSLLRRCLQLNYILPEKYAPGRKTVKRIALWLHIYYVELIPVCCAYAASMPEGADVIITTDTVHKQAAIKAAFTERLTNHIRVLLVENRGRDNSALLVGCAPYLEDYEIVCFAHDKKVGHLQYRIQGNAFSEHCFRNTLKSRAFVENVLEVFEENPRLGILCPPPPNMGGYFNTIGIADWGPNYENTKALYDRLNLNVPISRDYEPTAPFGSVFWFRTKALKPLFDAGWQYADFPEEPVDFDGTLLHAVERIYPYAAQQAGYYSGWLLSESGAALELTNYHHMLRELNKRIQPKCNFSDFKTFCAQAGKVEVLSVRLPFRLLKRWLKKHLPEKTVYRLHKLKIQLFRGK